MPLNFRRRLRSNVLKISVYFVEPQYLFTSIIDRINRKENILPQLERSLKRIEDSTLGQEVRKISADSSPILIWHRLSWVRLSMIKTILSAVFSQPSTGLTSEQTRLRRLTYLGMLTNI